jgi:hypothetical protein
VVVSAQNIAALVASIAAGVAALAAVFVTVVLTRRMRELRQIVHALGEEAVPLVRDAHVVMDHAATEMERVGDVLTTTEALSGTVDSASRLTYRIFANPVVKVLAFGTGARSALRRLFSRRDASSRSRRWNDERVPGSAREKRTDRATATAKATAKAPAVSTTRVDATEMPFGATDVSRDAGASSVDEGTLAWDPGDGRVGGSKIAPVLSHRSRRARRSRPSPDSAAR